MVCPDGIADETEVGELVKKSMSQLLCLPTMRFLDDVFLVELYSISSCQIKSQHNWILEPNDLTRLAG